MMPLQTGVVFAGTGATAAFASSHASLQWANPERITADDTDYAWCSNAYTLGQFQVTTSHVQLMHAGSAIGSAKGANGFWLQYSAGGTSGGDVGETEQHGGESDLWSAALTPAIVNASTFGVRIRAVARNGSPGHETNYLVATNFSFAIPLDFTILGAAVSFSRYAINTGRGNITDPRIDWVKMNLYYRPPFIRSGRLASASLIAADVMR